MTQPPDMESKARKRKTRYKISFLRGNTIIIIIVYSEDDHGEITLHQLKI